MSIHLDASTSRTVVITCTDCPYWAAIRFGMTEAHSAATNHERLLHAESENARRAARMYAARHAADSFNVPTPSAS
ncbi:MAG TPA: hypothetical protein VNJ04_11790 [Gemmatimonadaceae bacterium]|nr:hypothetical protein [Gemmatimonadaceae bacterium]